MGIQGGKIGDLTIADPIRNRYRERISIALDFLSRSLSVPLIVIHSLDRSYKHLHL